MRTTHYYSVDLWSYATQEEKAKAERAECDEEAVPWVAFPERIKGRHFYFGRDRQTAIRRFYKAAEAAMQDPLAYRMRMTRDFDNILIDLLLKHAPVYPYKK